MVHYSGTDEYQNLIMLTPITRLMQLMSETEVEKSTPTRNCINELHTQNTVPNETCNFLILILTHVSAALGHLQMLLLKLSHCPIYNLAFSTCVLIHLLDASSHFVVQCSTMKQLQQ
jgi:hypothetical protein